MRERSGPPWGIGARRRGRSAIVALLVLSGVALLLFSAVTLFIPLGERSRRDSRPPRAQTREPVAVERVRAPERRPDPPPPRDETPRPKVEPIPPDPGGADAPRPPAEPLEWSESRAIINELHYNPLEGDGREFVELANPGDVPLELGGWRLDGGVRFVFPDGTTLAPGGLLVVCGDAAALRATLEAAPDSGGAAPAGIFGDFEGRLSNAGERLLLLDGDGRLVDRLDYSDRMPFDPLADGRGPSLERLCAEAPSGLAASWHASSVRGGTPLATNSTTTCPPPELPARSPVVINELLYHPPGDETEPLEFLELHNRTDSEVGIGGWSLNGGVTYTFPPETRLAPRGYAVVAKQPGEVSRLAVDAPVLGPYDGRLSNFRDRVALVDASGLERDVVDYAQDGSWPARADGLGASLQRMSADVSGCLPRNWTVGLTKLEEAPETVLLTNGAPVMWFESLDDTEPRFNDRRPWFHPDFDARASGWRSGQLAVGYDTSSSSGREWVKTRSTTQSGVHAILVRVEFDVPAQPDELLVPRLEMDWDDGVIVWLNGKEILRENILLPRGETELWGRDYIADNASAKGDRSTEPVYQPVWTGRMSDLRPGRNVLAIGNFNSSPQSSDLFATARVVLGRATGLADCTPGRANVRVTASPPPRVASVERQPREARSSDAVTIRARVLGPDVASVTLFWRRQSTTGDDAPDGETEERVVLERGALADRDAEGELWSGTIPPQPDLSVVRYRLEAVNARGEMLPYPREGDPVGWAGYYVADAQPRTNGDLDAVHLLWNGTLSCADGVWLDGCTFVHEGTAWLDVRLKRRGDTSCRSPKAGLRVAFNKGALFRGQSRLNLLGGWQDRGMLRETVAWDLYRDAGHAYCETRMTAVYGIGGRFYGLFVALEEPDESFLRRNGLDDDASIWKCRTVLERSTSSGSFDKRTNEDNLEDRQTIADFARRLESLDGDALREFIHENVDIESIISYQAVKCLISDEDGYWKNWLLYHGTERRDDGSVADRWAPLPWDLDLSFGQIDLNNEYVHTNKHPLMGTLDHPRHGDSSNDFLEAVFGRRSEDYFIKALYGRIWRLLEEKFHPAVLGDKLARLDESTRVEMDEDLRRWPRWGRNRSNGESSYHRQVMRTYCEERWSFLVDFLQARNHTTRASTGSRAPFTSSRSGLGSWRSFRYTPAPRVKFTEIHFDPDEGGDLEFVELRNLESREVDIPGWSIPAIGFTFPDGSAIAADSLVVVARSPETLRKRLGIDESVQVLGPFSGRLANKGEALRLHDSGLDNGTQYYPETIDLVVYRNGSPWPDLRHNDGASLELRAVELDNDYGQNWRLSDKRHGTPGALP